MGDQRFVATYSRVRNAVEPVREIRMLPDESVIEALAGASRQQDPYLANVLATEALNRVRRTTALLAHLEDGVVGVSPSGVVAYANPAARALLREDALEGATLAGVVGDVAGDVLAVTDTSLTLRCEGATLKRPDGSLLRAAIVAAPIVEDGVPVGVVLAFRDVEEEERAAEALRRENALLAALADTTRALLGSLDPEHVLRSTVRHAGELAATPHGYVYLLDATSRSLVVAIGTGKFLPFVGFRLRLGEGLAGRAVEEARTILVDDYDAWGGRAAGIPKGVLHAAVAVPLVARGRAMGAIALAHADPERRFTAAEISILERFAELASLALLNARDVAALKTA